MKMKTCLVAGVVSALAATTPAQRSAAETNVDWTRIADVVVARWDLKRGERALIFWERTADRGAAAAIRKAIAARGGIVAGEIDLTDPRDDDAWDKAFEAADVAIWLPTRTRHPDRPFEHLVERHRRVRSIHFHWFLPDDSALHARVEAIYAKAVAVPPTTLAATQARLERSLRGARVRITSPGGTDLTLEVPADARFHRNTGDASRDKVAGARSVRDREEELPAGVLRTTDLRGVGGTLVGYATFATNGPLLAATFKNGRVTALESRRGAEEIVKRWTEAAGDKALPAELVISTNPALEPVLPGGFMPYYGYGAGIVRIAIGDNWESGGKNRSPLGETLFFLDRATVTVNGKAIVRDGKLVD